jgi:hypothetical protein
MRQVTKQEQAPARAEQLAPAGKDEHSQGRATREQALVELTETDLQAVTGGGGAGGLGGDVFR